MGLQRVGHDRATNFHFHFQDVEMLLGASQVALVVKNPPAMRRGFNPWVGKIPWRRKWQPTPVLFPGKSDGQRTPVGYRPWGCKESDTTEYQGVVKV